MVHKQHFVIYVMKIVRPTELFTIQLVAIITENYL